MALCLMTFALDMLLLSEAAGISSEELPLKMPMFSALGSQDVDCIPPELPPILRH